MSGDRFNLACGAECLAAGFWSEFGPRIGQQLERTAASEELILGSLRELRETADQGDVNTAGQGQRLAETTDQTVDLIAASGRFVIGLEQARVAALKVTCGATCGRAALMTAAVKGLAEQLQSDVQMWRQSPQ